ncbi:hypothetical protein HDU76_013191, partial [Blyttiomyces sp. JEL0837]
MRQLIVVAVFWTTFLALIPSKVEAHGRMLWPLPRLLTGDASNGYSYGRAASHDQCQFLPAGKPKTPALTGGAATFDYVITAAHQ